MGEGYLGRKDASSESGQIAGKLGPCWIVGIVRFFRGSLHMHEEHADGAKVKVDLVFRHVERASPRRLNGDVPWRITEVPEQCVESRRRIVEVGHMGRYPREPRSWPLPCAGVRIATWNVNSAKQRMPRLLAWLDERRPDVVCLQETKLADDAFAALLGDELADRGYAVAAHGETQWNGVAILSRAGLDDVVAGIPGGPGFPHQEARAVSATCGGIRVTSVYVPNGREPDSEHYRYKLAWLAALREMVAARARRRASSAAT